MTHHQPRAYAPAYQQRGATLIVALVMLVALAFLAIWAANSSTANLRIVGNAQVREEALAAAETAVEQTISTPLFIQEPAAVAASPIPVDVDGDGTADYEAVLTLPPCYKSAVKKNAELDPDVDGDKVCLGSPAPTAGIEIVGGGLPSGDSLCADIELNVRSEVTDPRTNAKVAVNQGIGVRSLSTDAETLCPAIP